MAQSKVFDFNENLQIKFIKDCDSLIIITKYNNNYKKYKYLNLSIDTSLYDKKNFIIKKNNNYYVQDFISIGDSIFYISIFDWNSFLYCFGFKIEKNELIPLVINNKKINEIFVTRYPYIFLNYDCGILLNIRREVQEYNFGNKSQYFFNVDLYNINDLEEHITFVYIQDLFQNEINDIYPPNKKSYIVFFKKITKLIDFCNF
ncbi:MAG TPA: hypothetical protein PLE28_03665 [bacterium]|nr:hypothetical protein [bacterium]